MHRQRTAHRIYILFKMRVIVSMTTHLRPVGAAVIGGGTATTSGDAGTGTTTDGALVSVSVFPHMQNCDFEHGGFTVATATPGADVSAIT